MGLAVVEVLAGDQIDFRLEAVVLMPLPILTEHPDRTLSDLLCGSMRRSPACGAAVLHSERSVSATRADSCSTDIETAVDPDLVYGLAVTTNATVVALLSVKPLEMTLALTFLVLTTVSVWAANVATPFTTVCVPRLTPPKVRET